MLINIVIVGLIVLIIITLIFLFLSPKEKVFLREKLLKMNVPIELEGKPDLVTIEKKKLRVYDLKTRAISKVYFSDLVQLTAYKMLLERTYKKEVIEGYIIITNPKFKKKIKINFLKEEDIFHLYNRNQQLAENPDLALLCKNRNVCKNCHFYQKKCFPDRI